MRSFYLSILSILLSLSLAACSSADEKPTNKNTGSTRSANSAAVNPVNATNSVNKETTGFAENEVVSDDPIGNIRKSKMEAMRKEAENSTEPKADIETLLKRSARPAPENSEFSAALTDIVFERRTFKAHPQLLKVEKITKGEKKTIKVYLIDGKVIELPGESVPFISTAPSSAILQAAGLSVPSSASKKPNAKTEDR